MDVSAAERELVEAVHDFVERDVRPVVRDMEHRNEYPEAQIEQMKKLGIYGLVVPEEFGGTPVSTTCFSMITEELSRGWMSLAGAMGGHTVVCMLIREFGTEDQKNRFLPVLATGEIRATMALTEAQGGSDLQAITTVVRRDGDEYVVNGTKTWIGSSRHAGLTALLCKTDPDAEPRYRGISILLVEPGDGFTVVRDLLKLGYKGVESCEIRFEDYRCPTTALLGETEGKGFSQMMTGLEIGRIQVASRALGVGRAAFEDSLAYAQERVTFGQPIWRHQSIGNYLADMATKLSAARQLVHFAARKFDTKDCLRLHGGLGTTGGGRQLDLVPIRPAS